MRPLRLAPLLFVLALAGCFSPDQPICTFRCDSTVGNGGACPANYLCQVDGYCHLIGSTGMCPYPDAAVSPDLSVTPVQIPDLAVSASDDGGDAATPFDATPTFDGPTCTDHVKDGDETDVDCGGSCSPCATTKGCVLDKDCASGLCLPSDGGMSACAAAPADMALPLVD